MGDSRSAYYDEVRKYGGQEKYDKVIEQEDLERANKQIIELKIIQKQKDEMIDKLTELCKHENLDLNKDYVIKYLEDRIKRGAK